MVVDDHPIVRAGVSGLLETEPDFDVVGEAASGEEALALAAATAPDVILMDLRMPGMGGVEATRRLTRQHGQQGGQHPAQGEGAPPRVLVFTTYEDDDEILAAIEAGASGYLVKAGPATELAAGVRAVAAGQTVLAPTIAAQIVARAQKVPVALTPRETQILGLVAEGLSNPAIAVRLHIGESTVKTHLLHVFEKLEVSDRTRAVTRAMELKLLPALPGATAS
nr:response regulator transcription factor [Leucobacter exalbidus]